MLVWGSLFIFSGCGVTVEQTYSKLSEDTHFNDAQRIPVFEPGAFSEDMYTVIEALDLVVCRGGKGKFKYGGSDTNAKMTFKLQTFKLNGNAVVNFRCSEPSFNLDSLGQGCLSGMICEADAARF